MMPRRSAAASALATVVMVGIWAVLAPGVSAQRLPVREYSTTDGLSADFVIDIYRDARGFLWFSTRDGLSRFDGTQFRTYNQTDGLPHPTVNAVLETRDGTYWVATNGGGVARLEVSAPAHFVPFPVGPSAATNRVNALLEATDGRLWVATDDGAFVRGPGSSAAFEPVDLQLPSDAAQHGVNTLLQTPDGSVWLGGGFGLRRSVVDGRLIHYNLASAGPRDAVTALALAADGHVWVGYRRGLLTFTPAPAGERLGTAQQVPSPGEVSSQSLSPAEEQAFRWFLTDAGLPSDAVSALLATDDGHVWVGTTAGVAEWTGDRFKTYPSSSGMPGSTVSDLDVDAGGNIWVATLSGVSRLVRRGLLSYSVADGLADARVHSIAEDRTGALEVITGDFVVNRFDGRRFAGVRALVSGGGTCNWMSPCGHLDPSGGWWMLTSAGLDHWRPSARWTTLADPPFRTYRAGAGLPDSDVFSAFTDSRGRLWVGRSLGGISVLEPESGRWRALADADGLPLPGTLSARVTAFAEDRQGHIWVGLEGGGVLRERDLRFTHVDDDASTLAGWTITTLFADEDGRMWVGSNRHGLGRIDEADAGTVRVQVSGIEAGLSSSNVRAITSDRRGRLYVGTSLGVDCLVIDSGEITHYTVNEGLASQFVTAAFRDHAGTLWFGTINGLSRLDMDMSAQAPADASVPQVFISRIRAAGVPQPVSDLGDVAPPPFQISAGSRRLEVEYFALGPTSGAQSRYQYRLDDDGEWSVPTSQRAVNFAYLAPGDYRLLVRSVRPDGAVGASPAVVAFSVLPPVYAQPWFVGLVGLVVMAGATLAYRLRVAQLLRVERVRARIATDLHDDIGASLSQIAILAEVARTQATGPATNPADGATLSRIAETSRTLVDSMSDIVWAINPEVDSLADLIHRMRRFVEDTLGALDMDVTFDAPEPDRALKLGADVRREVFLILKESVNNIAKHSQSRSAAIRLRMDRRVLRLEVCDQGRGFDPALRTDGNGVASMRRRVASLGGRLTIDSAPGSGTHIRLELELARPLGRLLQP